LKKSYSRFVNLFLFSLEITKDSIVIKICRSTYSRITEQCTGMFYRAKGSY